MLTVADVGDEALRQLLNRYGLDLEVVAAGQPIPGSFWGDSEAGIIDSTVHVRGDTPVHSFLHETCHLICMTTARRRVLHRDAGGSDLEEAAVCFLQIVLAEYLDGADRLQVMQDMDAWGYSFRLGSTLEWFQSDAADADEFLQAHGLMDERQKPSFRLRD